MGAGVLCGQFKTKTPACLKIPSYSSSYGCDGLKTWQQHLFRKANDVAGKEQTRYWEHKLLIRIQGNTEVLLA